MKIQEEIENTVLLLAGPVWFYVPQRCTRKEEPSVSTTVHTPPPIG